MSKSVTRALQVIASLADEPASATNVATMTGVSLSTAVRLLQVLEKEGFARRDTADRYHIGARLLSIAYQAVASMDIRQIAAPILRQLNRETGQTIHFAYFDNRTLLYIDKYDGTAPVSMRSRVGLAAPLHCTAIGKAVIAFRPEDERAHLMKGMDYTKYTERTIISPEIYLRELDEVRRRGYALNLGEHEAVVSAVAVPLIQADGLAEYAVDLAVPNFLVSDDELRSLVPRVVQAAHDIEASAGFRKD